MAERKQEIILYETRIVSWDKKTVTLDNGGFKTAMTRRAMNSVSREYELEFNVWAKRGVWVVETWDGVQVPFSGNSVTVNLRPKKNK